MSKRKFWTSSNEARSSLGFGGARACRALGLAEAGSRKTEECRQAASMITPVSNVCYVWKRAEP
jgi:hypothetical protein